MGGEYNKGKEVCFHAQIIMTVPPDIAIPSLTIHSLVFPITVHQNVTLRTKEIDLFTNLGAINSESRGLVVFSAILLGVSGGVIQG